VWSSCISHKYSSSIYIIYIYANGIEFITSSEDPESTATILAPMPADISMEHTNIFDYSRFDSYDMTMSFGELLKYFWCQNEAYIIGQNSSLITTTFEHKWIA